MHRAFPNRKTQQGFTLIEILVAMVLTVLLMLAASQLMTAMKRSSDRMRLNSEARNRAQRALDYMHFQLRGAGDMNPWGGNPLAILTWYQRGSSNVQATYNNVTNSSLGDIGTDIITIARPDSNVSVPVRKWLGAQSSSASWWGLGTFCPDGTARQNYFKQVTGEHGGKSDPILLVNEDGDYSFYQITDYSDAWNINSGCSQTPPELHVIANPGNSVVLNPLGAQPGLTEPHMVLGVKFYSFRVRNGWLEQKEGMFNPATDNPGSDFVALLPNIEDFQIAWIYNDGTIWNTASQQLPAGTYTNSVPTLAAGNQYDCENVSGFRVSFVARSSAANSVMVKTTFRRPAVEDRAQGAPDRFYHERATSLLMIRNRNLRN